MSIKDKKIKHFSGCYDLINMQSLPAGDEKCNSGIDTNIPARPTTKEMVEDFLRGAKLNFTTDKRGVRSLSVAYIDRPSLVTAILDDPPPVEKEKPKKPPKKKRPKRRRRARKMLAQSKGPKNDPGMLVVKKSLSPRKNFVKNGPSEEPPLSTHIEVRLPAPQRDETALPASGTANLDRLMKGISKRVDRMQCGSNGCSCTRPPCIPCSLDYNKRKGRTEDQWAARWIVWYSTKASLIERMIAAKSLSVSEKELLQSCKYRWGYTDRVSSKIASFNWDRGKVQAHRINRKKFAKLIGNTDVQVVRHDQTDSKEIQGAISIATDPEISVDERIHAIRWIASQSDIGKKTKEILRKVALNDSDESIRKEARQAIL